MARPTHLPPPTAKLRHTAIRLPDGEIDWAAHGCEPTRLCRRHPPQWQAPETRACLAPGCIEYFAALAAKKSRISRIALRSTKVWYAKSRTPWSEFPQDVAGEMLLLYSRADVPVSLHPQFMQLAIINAGMRKKKEAKGDDMTIPEELAYDDLGNALADLRQMAYWRELDGARSPEKAVARIQMLAVAECLPDEAFAYFIGELTLADCQKIGMSEQLLAQARAALQEAYCAP